MEEHPKINDLSSTITLSSGLIAKIGDLGLMDSIEDTYVWVHMVEACPRMLVQLYHGLIRIFSKHTANLEGSLALMEDRVKEQVAGVELGDMFILCGNLVLQSKFPAHS